MALAALPCPPALTPVLPCPAQVREIDQDGTDKIEFNEFCIFICFRCGPGAGLLGRGLFLGIRCGPWGA